jgi:hypothetical protein
MVVGFMSLSEHAPSVKSRIRRVLRPQLTDPMSRTGLTLGAVTAEH